MASKPAGIFIPKKFLKNMWANNPHGLGFVIAKNNQLILKKGFRNFKDFWQVFRDCQQYPAIIHMRWANRGVVSKENDHPFIIDDSLAFAHNGTISIDLEGDHSDTKMFCSKILQPMRERDDNFLDKPFNRWLISKSIGQSKLIFLKSNGELVIINDSLGETEGKVWFSNKDYKNFTRVVTGFKGNGKTAVTTVTGNQQQLIEAYEHYY